MTEPGHAPRLIARVQRIIDILAGLTEEELITLHAALTVMIGGDPPAGVAVTTEPPEPSGEGGAALALPTEEDSHE